tara:strand:- start:2875 stop:4017 length:1143 start_codon:yes stop_codon:yes gene_type:complete
MSDFIPFGKPILNEEELNSVNEVLQSGILVHGKFTNNFETKFAQRNGSKHAIAVSSCTAGMHLGLFISGIGRGAKVAVPAMTHVATAHVVELQGAQPVFIDVDPKTGNMSTTKLQEASKLVNLDAIIPVHYLGLPCDMDEINNIASKNNSLVIEDCALSLDAEYKNKKTGSLADLGSFSFYPVKHITSIEGGMVTTDNDEIATKIRKSRAFGYNKSLGERTRPGLYDVDSLGFNYRMNEVEAAVGLNQLNKIDQFIKLRERNFKILQEKVSSIPGITTFPSEFKGSKSSYYCFNFVLPENEENKRNELQDSLKDLGIGTSIHYPSAVPMFEYYRNKYGYNSGDFPVSEWLAANTLSIGIAPHVSEENAIYIANNIYQLLK